MRLTVFSKNLKPVTIAVGLLSTPSFVYSDIDSYSKIITTITDKKTFEYLKLADEGDWKFYSLKYNFQELLEKWEKETCFLSSPKAIIEHQDFQSIVKIGYKAVPFIVDEIERNPSSLVWALNLIFQKKISNDSTTTIPEACKLWVKRLRNQ